MGNKIKQQIYNVVAYAGMWVLHKIFPEQFGKEALGITDRFVEYPWVLQYLALYDKVAPILDVGCASSLFTPMVWMLGYNISGIDVRDVDTNMFRFYKCNICENSFEENTFRMVTAISTIEHIGISKYAGDYTDFSAINEIHRILVKGGLFLMTVPFADKHKVTTFHRLYDRERIDELMKIFSHTEITTVPSPEGDYKLALIMAVK